MSSYEENYEPMTPEEEKKFLDDLDNLDINKLESQIYEVELKENIKIRKQKTYKCKFCDEAGLEWRQINNKWKFFKDNKEHRCKK